MRKFKYLIGCFCFLGSTLLYSNSVSQYHKVKKGETLSSISKKYNTNIANIKSLNNIKGSVIYPGQRIVVKKTIIAAQRTQRNDNSSYTTTTKYYKVSKGDNLYKISKKFNVSVPTIKKLNNLRSDRLNIGQNLKIAVSYKDTPKLLPQVNTPSPIISTSDKVYYTVKKDDTLESIAEKFEITSEDLKQANLLSDCDFKEGQVLVIQKHKPIVEKDTPENVATEAINPRGRLIKEAFAYLGTPYRLGGKSEKGLDCSGLTRILYGNIGLSLPTTSYQQYKEGVDVNIEEAVEGDLLFFKRGGAVNHVAIYIGDKLFIHASSAQKKVAIASFDNAYFKRHFVAAKRYLPLEDDTIARRIENVIEK